jgi:hypothetical protein
VLPYLNPATIRPQEWESREDEGILIVPRAGEMLYRVRMPCHAERSISAVPPPN